LQRHEQRSDEPIPASALFYRAGKRIAANGKKRAGKRPAT